MMIFAKIKEVGIYNFIIGLIYYIRNLLFMKIFKYNKWHLSSMYLRPYLKYMSQYLNKDINEKIVVDIGCGNGELLRSLINVKGYGLDLSNEIIKYANFLNYKSNIKFNVGTLSTVNIQEKNIDYLILLNWTHSVSFDEFSRDLNVLLESYNVFNIIIDYVPDYCNHDISRITKNRYLLEEKKFGFLRDREVHIYIREKNYV